MLKKIYYFALNTLLVASYAKEYLYFKYSSLNIEKTQKKILLRILRKNRNTIYGKKYKFSSIDNIKDFQRKVPVINYDSYKKYIKQIKAGKKNVLTKDRVILLEPTSGSTAPSKFIPYTKGLKKEFQKGIGPWIFDIYTKRKRLLIGDSYWSITPIIKNKHTLKSKIPIGFEEDTEYFGTFQKFLINKTLAVPKEVNNISDIDSFRYVTLLFLLKDKNLRFVSIWNPTYTTFLLENLNHWLGNLIKDIDAGVINDSAKIDPGLRNNLLKKLGKNEKRARELRDILRKWKSAKHNVQKLYKDIWPNLALISCWTSSNSVTYVNEIKKCFPNAEVQGKGLIATEGFVSFPIFNLKFPILSINSHFFEFIDIKTKEIKLSHQLTINRKYSVVVTTSGGFYRYNLGDLIQVLGHFGKAPLIRFVGKENNVSDLFGEKLNHEHITHIFKKLFKRFSVNPNFFMLAPCTYSNKVSYVIFLQCSNGTKKKKLIQFKEDFEKELRKNYHYDYCIKLGQLGRLRLFKIYAKGAENYMRALHKRGQKIGDIKHSVLGKNINWLNIFQGKFVS